MCVCLYSSNSSSAEKLSAQPRGESKEILVFGHFPLTFVYMNCVQKRSILGSYRLNTELKTGSAFSVHLSCVKKTIYGQETRVAHC